MTPHDTLTPIRAPAGPAATVHGRWLSPLGPLHLAASPRGLAGAWFEDQRHLPASLPGPGHPAWRALAEHPLLQAASKQLAEYFAGQRQGFTLALDLGAGTPFQQAVWQALLAIPHGQSRSYGALARQIGRERAVRAVGAAVGRNPLSIVVPCHRVLGTDGSLTGYAGGLARKTALLRLEGLVWKAAA